MSMKTRSFDFGLFGPDSLAWKIHSHPSAWVGGIRALLLQALEPRAMAGVVQFSQYGDDAWQRFRSTSDFVMTVTYRSSAQAKAAIRHVRKVHEPISGIDHHTGKSFSANDPYLMAYVHNCLVDSLLSSYVNFSASLSAGEKDKYVEEMFSLADLLGADTDEVPRRAGDLSDWLSSRSDLLLTDEARHAAGTLKRINIAEPFRPAWNLAWNAALSIMPSYASELYSFKKDPLAAEFYKGAGRLVAITLKLTLPSHPYCRSAKYAYYEHYAEDNGSRCAFQFQRMLGGLSSLSPLAH